MPRLQQMKKVAQIVFTVPVEVRHKLADIVALADAGSRGMRMLKRRGIPRGFRRWHFFGDKSSEWAPHLNVLCEAGYLDPKGLASLKAGWLKILRSVGYKGDVVDVHYSYADCSTPRGQRRALHWIKYVMRPTILKESWGYGVGLDLRGMRNNLAWGTWTGEQVWGLKQKNELCRCGDCGEVIRWTRPLAWDEMKEGAKEIEPGMYEVQPGWGRLALAERAAWGH